LKKPQEIVTSNRLITLIPSLIGILLVLASVLYIPNIHIKYSHYERGMLIALLLFIFGVFNFIYAKDKVAIGLSDIGWWGLILLSGLSALWSTNPYYAIFGMFTTLLVYLSFKFFEAIQWTNTTSQYLNLGIQLCIFVAMGTIIYAIYYPTEWQILSRLLIRKLTNSNFNFLGSLIVILMPYFLFQRGSFRTVFNLSFLLVTIYILYKTGSAQVVLASLFLLFCYLLFLIKVSKKWFMSIMASLFICTIIAIIFIYKNEATLRTKSFVWEEFYQQNDRMTMWQNSFKLFKKKPLLGIGKNNWKAEVYQYGYNHYAPGINNNYKPKIYHHTHNSFFQTLSELGLLGLLSLVWIGYVYLLGLKQKPDFDDLEYTSLISILIFLLLSSIYGIIYNHFESFKGIPIFMTLSLALVTQKNASKWRINNKYFYIVFILATISSFTFFYCSKFAKYHYREGIKIQRDKKFKAAENTLNKALFCWDNGLINQHLAKSHKGQNNLNAANQAYQKAIQYSPHNPVLLYNYGSFLYNQQRYKEALVHAKNAYILSNKYFENRLLLAKSYLKNKKLKKAKEIIIKLNKDLDERLRIENITLPGTKTSVLENNPKHKKALRRLKRLKEEVKKILAQIDNVY